MGVRWMGYYMGATRASCVMGQVQRGFHVALAGRVLHGVL